MNAPQVAPPRDVPYHNRLPLRRRHGRPVPLPIAQAVRWLLYPAIKLGNVDHIALTLSEAPAGSRFGTCQRILLSCLSRLPASRLINAKRLLRQVIARHGVGTRA